MESKVWVGGLDGGELTRDQVIATWEKAVVFTNSPFFEFWTTKMDSGRRMIVIKIGKWARRLIYNVSWRRYD